MGVVRREGDWRLEKVDEGGYEITYEREPQLKVITPDYREPFGSFDMLPVREVNSYEEAEGLFEEHAHGPPPLGMGGGGPLDDTSSLDSGLLDRTGAGGGGSFLRSASSGSESGSENIDAPPGFVALALIIVGVFFILTEGFAPNSTIFQVGFVMVLIGLAILGWGGFLYWNDGWDQASDFLFDSGKGKPASTSVVTSEKTPPAPEKLKNEIIFDRANLHCEWCGDRFDSLHVHHIEPRSEGGPNTKRNLIALCPNCHDKADRSVMSRSKLKSKVRRNVAD